MNAPKLANVLILACSFFGALSFHSMPKLGSNYIISLTKTHADNVCFNFFILLISCRHDKVFNIVCHFATLCCGMSARPNSLVEV